MNKHENSTGDLPVLNAVVTMIVAEFAVCYYNRHCNPVLSVPSAIDPGAVSLRG
jgi:hypothetical protein